MFDYIEEQCGWQVMNEVKNKFELVEDLEERVRDLEDKVEDSDYDYQGEYMRESLKQALNNTEIMYDELVAIAKIDANLPVRINFYTQALILIANIN